MCIVTESTAEWHWAVLYHVVFIGLISSCFKAARLVRAFEAKVLDMKLHVSFEVVLLSEWQAAHFTTVRTITYKYQHHHRSQHQVHCTRLLQTSRSQVISTAARLLFRKVGVVMILKGQQQSLSHIMANPYPLHDLETLFQFSGWVHHICLAGLKLSTIQNFHQK